ncbi:MAG: hypothetical protein NUV51_09265 [Sulfuricaulis sp.]|nr:hypothetical protein [Sulfuricaulis sp.]
MAVVITIAGVTKSMLGGYTITETANGRNTFSCQVLSEDGSYTPALNAEVIVTEDAVRIFGGNIDTPSLKGVGNEAGTPIVTSVSAVDFNALAGHRYVTLDIVAGTLKAALQAIDAGGFFPPGVTLDPAQIAGPTLPALSYQFYEERCRLSTIFDEIAGLDATQKLVWEIDYDKVLRMFLPASTPAPVNIIDGDGHAIGDVHVEPTRSNYANRVIALYDIPVDAVKAYAFLKQYPPSGGNFVDGDTVTIGSRTYTFQTTLTDVDGNVKLGTTEALSLAHLRAAIMLEGGSNYAASTTANTEVEAFIIEPEGQLRIRALTAGVAGNSIGAATNVGCIAYFWGEGHAPLDHLYLGSDAYTYSGVVTAEDPSALTDPWEKVISVGAVSAAVAQASVDAALALALATPDKVAYRTFEKGLHPGQTQTITVAKRGVNGTFLITDVIVRNVEPGVIVREVTAIEGVAPILTWRGSPMWSGGGGAAGGWTVAPSITLTGITGLGTPGELAEWVTSSTLGNSTGALIPIMAARVALRF